MNWPTAEKNILLLRPEQAKFQRKNVLAMATAAARAFASNRTKIVAVGRNFAEHAKEVRD